MGFGTAAKPISSFARGSSSSSNLRMNAQDNNVDITTDDVRGSCDLATALLEMLLEERVPPGRAASALALALGRVCARFDVRVAHAVLLLGEAHYVEKANDGRE